MTGFLKVFLKGSKPAVTDQGVRGQMVGTRKEDVVSTLFSLGGKKARAFSTRKLCERQGDEMCDMKTFKNAELVHISNTEPRLQTLMVKAVSLQRVQAVSPLQ